VSQSRTREDRTLSGTRPRIHRADNSVHASADETRGSHGGCRWLRTIVFNNERYRTERPLVVASELNRVVQLVRVDAFGSGERERNADGQGLHGERRTVAIVKDLTSESIAGIFAAAACEPKKCVSDLGSRRARAGDLPAGK
jgi:hypothetical protein